MAGDGKRFKKGRKKTGGRKKGSPNHLPARAKQVILHALAINGGADYLAKQARKNPRTFMHLLGKIVPREVQSEVYRSEVRLLRSEGDE